MVSVKSMTKKCTKPITVAVRVLAISSGSAIRPTAVSIWLMTPFFDSTKSQE
ncbi:hypothetical protein D3C80_2032820 [compost metagenome]